MADNTTMNPGTGGDTVAADDIAGVKYQRVKLIHGADGVNDGDVSSANGFPVDLITAGAHFAPGLDVAAGPGAGGPLHTDPDGNLATRGTVLTDELGYRANFANTSLEVTLNSFATFTNGSANVTGTVLLSDDLRRGDYVKLSADAESAWVQVENIVSATALTLVAAYSGTGGTGAAVRAIVKPSTGTGGTIAVASGACTIASGTTINSISEVERDVDWLPVLKQSGVTISQRIANHTTNIGFYDEAHPATPYYFAWFAADGTTNTTIKCRSGRNPTGAPSASETEETTVTLPNGGTTAASHRYRTEVLGDRVNFFIDGWNVATHYRAMPGPGDVLTSTVRSTNGGSAPATSTTITIDYDTVKNHNKLEVGLLSDSEGIVSTTPPAQIFSYTAGAVVIAINTDILLIDCLQFRSLSLHVGAIGTTGVVTGAWSNDGSTDWSNVQFQNPTGGAATTISNAAPGVFVTPVRGRYFRLRMTTATTAAGATRINIAAFQSDMSPLPPSTQAVSGTVTANIGIGALAAGTNAIGDFGMQYRANATGAATLTNINCPATPAPQQLKSGAGRLLGLFLYNTSASTRWVKIFNLASASVTAGTTSATTEIGIPAGSQLEMKMEGGAAFSTGITVMVTAGAGLTNNSAVTLADVTGFSLHA